MRDNRQVGFLAICLVLAFLFSIGCASTPPKALTPSKPSTDLGAPLTYGINQEVLFEGMRFNLRSAEFRRSYTWGISGNMKARDTFLIVEIVSTNLSAKALPDHFQPVFYLIDSFGAEYVADKNHTMKINYDKPGPELFQEWNPNVPVQREIVFEVPKETYKLRVLVPSRAQAGFQGSTTVTGRFFYYDISGIKESLQEYKYERRAREPLTAQERVKMMWDCKNEGGYWNPIAEKCNGKSKSR